MLLLLDLFVDVFGPGAAVVKVRRFLFMLRDIINQGVVFVEPGTKIIDVARLMEEKDVGCVLVLDNDKPRGILTDRDIVVRCLAKNIDVSDCSIENVMTESVDSVKDTDGIFDCIEHMRKAGVRRIPVVDSSGKAIGIVSFGDLLAVLSKEFYDLAQSTTAAGRDQRLKAAA